MHRSIILILAIVSCTSRSQPEKLDTISLDSLNTIAFNYFMDEKYDTAELLLTEIIERDNSDERALYTYIDLQLIKGNNLKAYSWADSLTHLNPEAFPAWVMKGIAVEQLFGVDSAIHHYRYALDEFQETVLEGFIADLVAVVNQRPLTEQELDSLGIDYIEQRNELLYYDQGGWVELNRSYYDLTFQLDSVIPWKHMSNYLNQNGINYRTAEKAENGFLIYTKKKFKNRALELGLKLGPATFDWTVSKARKAKFTNPNEKRKTTL